MAYQIKRQKRIQEELELLNSDGTVAYTIVTDLTVDNIAKDFRACQIEIVHAQQRIKDTDNIVEATEQLGNAIIKFFNLIFGEVQTEILLKFYENNYTEMATEVLGFINSVIAPEIKKAVDERKKQIKGKYGMLKGKR